MSLVGALIASVGIVALWWSLNAAGRERDEWRHVAGELAQCVRGIDAWPVVPAERVDGPVTLLAAPLSARGRGGMTVVPVPPGVAVIGREAQLDRWSLQASTALARYDLLLEPEGDR